MDYSRERDGRDHIELTWAQFGKRLRAIAARLQQVTKPGDRVAILAPQMLEYVIGFFGSLYAGNIAVPLFSRTSRVTPTDCTRSSVTAPRVRSSPRRSRARRSTDFFKHLPAKERPRVIAVDAVPDSVGETWRKPLPHLHDIAYLQYTSGSTRTPAGVEITYESVSANAADDRAMHLTDDSRGVTWLPMFGTRPGPADHHHPALGGKYITIMSPAAFVRRPGRWINELAALSDGAGTFAAAPNFATSTPRPEVCREKARPSISVTSSV